MAKFIEIIINIFDPISREELRMERRWNARLQKIQNKMNESRN